MKRFLELQQEEFKELNKDIIGVGIDIEPFSRFKNIFSMINNGKLKKLFYPSELEYCKSSLFPERELAKIWCLKEATVKAFSGFAKINVFDIEVKKNQVEMIKTNYSNIENVFSNYKIHFAHSSYECLVVALVLIEKLVFNTKKYSYVNITKKTKITGDMLTIKRPGYGIKPKFIDIIIGREAKQDIAEDQWITWEMI